MQINKKGGTTDIFLFLIFTITILFICGIFIYLGGQATTKVHQTMDNMQFGSANTSQVIDQTFGKVNEAYQSLYWISLLLIVGMIISIFIGSYLVTTKPIFFIPYIFIIIIAVIVSVGLSNAYEQVIQDPTLAPTFAGFIGSNFIMANLPIWITIIGFVGGIIMFTRMGSRENQGGGTIYG
jgi:flagellar biosynthesis protein FliQ